MLEGIAAVHSEDIALLGALRLGDGDAAALLMQRHNRTLWRIARGVLRDDGEAEEAVQDTWLRAFASARAYRGEASIGTWLARIAINEALRRANRRHPTDELDPIVDLLPVGHRGSATMMPPVGPEHAAARAEIGRIVEHAIDTLPMLFRVVFMMRVVEQPFDWFKSRAEGGLWVPVPAAARAVFPSTGEIMRRGSVPAKQFNMEH